MSTEQLNQLLRQAEALSAEEKLLLAKRLIEQADSAQATDLKRPLSGRETVQKLEQEFAKIRGDIPEDSPDLSSEWWIQTIKEAKTIKDLKVDFD